MPALGLCQNRRRAPVRSHSRLLLQHLVTTPAPTVRPPSRIAKRSSFSMAMGWMSVTSMVTCRPA